MCVVWIASLITFVRNDNYCLNILIFCHYEEQRDEVIQCFEVYWINGWVMDCHVLTLFVLAMTINAEKLYDGVKIEEWSPTQWQCLIKSYVSCHCEGFARGSPDFWTLFDKCKETGLLRFARNDNKLPTFVFQQRDKSAKFVFSNIFVMIYF